MSPPQPRAGQHSVAIVASIKVEMKEIICKILESCLARYLVFFFFFFLSYSLVCFICFLFIYLFAVYKKKTGTFLSRSIIKAIILRYPQI